MEKSYCPFGPLFRIERHARGISLWQLVHGLNYYLANLQRIEKGKQQPGVDLAFRMFKAVGICAGNFMGRLAADNFQELPGSISRFSRVEVNYKMPMLKMGMKSPFGPLLLQAREAAAISQTAMARASGYHLRNINSVEKGIQEPGIMTALALVMTTGVNVCDFFDYLYMVWKDVSR